MRQLRVARADLNSPPSSEPTQRQKIKEMDKLKKNDRVQNGFHTDGFCQAGLVNIFFPGDNGFF